MTLVFRTRSLTSLDLASLARIMTHESQDLPISTFPALKILPLCPAVLCESWGSNPGPHAYTASALATEPPAQLPNHFLEDFPCKFLLLVLITASLDSKCQCSRCRGSRGFMDISRRRLHWQVEAMIPLMDKGPAGVGLGNLDIKGECLCYRFQGVLAVMRLKSRGITAEFGIK